MSSILDALNKLEQAKAARAIALCEEEIPPVSPEQAAAVLLGTGQPRTKMNQFYCIPWKPVLAALVLGIGLTSLTMLVTFWVIAAPTRTVAALPADTGFEDLPVHTYYVPLSEEPNTNAAVKQEEIKNESATAVTAPMPRNEQQVSGTRGVTAPKLEQAKKETRKESVVAMNASVQKSQVLLTGPANTNSEVSESPLSLPEENYPLPDGKTLLQETTAHPTEEQVEKMEEGVSEIKLARAQKPQSLLDSGSLLQVTPPPARNYSGNVEVNSLPRLTMQEREQLGLDSLRLNVLRPASKEQPDALAIINLKKVYVGEIIPGTRARLIGVESGAIGVEVETGGSVKRFRISR